MWQLTLSAHTLNHLCRLRSIICHVHVSADIPTEIVFSRLIIFLSVIARFKHNNCSASKGEVCVHTSYQLKLDQYPPPKCKAGCDLQMKDQFWISQRAQNDRGELVVGSNQGFSGGDLDLRK